MPFGFVYFIYVLHVPRHKSEEGQPSSWKFHSFILTYTLCASINEGAY